MNTASMALPPSRPRFWPYVLVGLFCLALALLAQAPARLMQKFWPASLPVQATAWGGSLWSGQMAWRHGETQGQLRWRLRPWTLVLGKLSLDLEAGGALQLNGRAALGLGGWSVSGLQGEVPGELIQGFLPGGWSFPGAVQMQGVSLGREGYKSGAWDEALGQLAWGGGAMRLSVNGQSQDAQLPPLNIVLGLADDKLQLRLVEAAGQSALGEVLLGADNMLETRLRQRLLRYSPSYRGQGDPEQVVVTSRQPL